MLRQRVLRMARAAALGPGASGCGADGAHSGDPQALSGDLRGASDPRRAGRGGHPSRPQADRSTDATGGLGGHQPTQTGADHATPRGRPPGARSRRARLRRRGPGSSVGRRHHLHLDLVGLSLLGCGGGRLESAGDRLVDGASPEDRARARGTEYGALAAPAKTGDPPLGPGHAVHLDRFWQTLQAGRRTAGRWARSATATTMLCARASSRRSSASCSTATASVPRLKPGWPSSISSRAGTTRSDATRPSATSAQQSSRAVRRQRRMYSDRGALRVSVGTYGRGARQDQPCRSQTVNCPPNRGSSSPSPAPSLGRDRGGRARSAISS